MRDDPRRNLKWLEQELLAEEDVFQTFTAPPEIDYEQDDDLLELVDKLIEEETEEVSPSRNPANRRSRKSQAERIQQAQASKLDSSAAVLVKTKKQLRQEAKQKKTAEKKANINRNIKDLVFLAILEILGILAILGWWLQ